VSCLVIASHHASVTSDFRASLMASQARRSSPPNRVRYPTDQQFASGCSPRRFEPTQLPSATELWHTPTRTFTVLMWRPHGRTMPAFAGMTVERPPTSFANFWDMTLDLLRLPWIVRCSAVVLHELRRGARNPLGTRLVSIGRSS
jgi:hypothetical protein